MKPRFTLALSSLAALATLAGCGNSSSNLPPFGVETIRQSELLIPNKKGEASPSGLAFDLLFKAKSEIPYISLKDGFGFLNFVKAARLSDPKNEKYFYRLTGEGNRFVVTAENGASATFDVAAQTVAYSDFENFVALPPSPEAKPLALYSPAPKVKAIALTKSEFKKGKDVTITLKSYEGVDLYLREGVPYLPLATFNDMFYNIFEYSNLAYNYKDVYLATDNAFMSRLGGLPVLTAYGESFFSGPKKETVSEELRQFNYAEACLNFDNFYGLKKDKGFSSFASFIEEKGFKGDFFSADTKKADAALRLASSHLVDGHTAGTLTSPLYAFGEATDDETRANQQRAKWLSGSERLQASRGNGEAALGNSLDATGGVYYIAFNDFTANDEDLMYTSKELLNPDAIKSSTALQFNDAYTFLTDPANKDKAKTIVVDLATNDGGSADALVFGLCTLLGEVKSTCISPITGAENHSSYKADINLDGKIDEKDVPLCKDYNIVFLNSIYTFSSGNAMPAIAKDNNAKVMTVGETSGGGACIVRPLFTPLASGMYLSGLQAIATEKDGKLVHVDKGVPADHAIEQNSMFSRSFISTMVNGWLEEK